MNYIEIGKIVNVHALKGEIKIYPYTEDIDKTLDLEKIYLDDKKEYLIENIRFHKNMFVTKLKGIDTIEQAEKLRDIVVYREVTKNEALDDETYYIKDLIGLKVYLDDNTYFGVIKDVLKYPANDVYIVEQDDAKQVLIPVIHDVVKQIDIKNQKIIISLMEGLL